jgi:WD40 repeat protein
MDLFDGLRDSEEKHSDKAYWEIGDVIDGLYRVWGMASGDMGTVYFVEHLGWKKNLAVKSIRPEFLRDNEAKKTFIHEIESWINLGLHPHIVTCFYIKEIGGLLRVFTEYVDGISLKKTFLERKIKDIKTVLDLAIQFCRGMDYAHRRGVIHGDIKPENCLLTNYGILKISGFGLTKISGIVTPELGNLDISNLMEGSIVLFKGKMGTPEYMAPEQFEGRADFSSDIYSFGVMLFEMVCGRRPYVMSKEIHQVPRVLFYEKAHKEVIPPNPKDLRPDCPEGLRRLILQCLEKEKEKRPKSFKEIEDEIIKLYKEITEEDYLRPEVDERSLIASNLNNRALSLLDLEKKEEAENLLRQAVEKDPVHPEAVYNLALLEWRSGRIDDLEAVERIKEVCKSYPGEWLPIYLLASFHLEREDNEKALSVLEEIKNVNHEIKELYSLAQSSPGIKCLRTFQGHNSPVISVCFSQDGRYALSGSSDYTLKLWDVETGKCLRTFWHSGTVNSVSFSPDGKFALSGSEDKTLKLWDVETAKCLRTFEGHRDVVTSACFSPDGRYALSGSSDKTLKLWDVETGKCLRTFKGHRDVVLSVSFSPDGRYALSGSWDETIKLWDVETGKRLRTFKGHESGVTSVCFSPDGRYALSGSWDDTLKLWDVESGECIRTFKGHKSTVNSVCFSPDGRYALSGSWDKTLKLWDVKTGRCLRTFEGHKYDVNSVCFSPDGKFVLSGSEDNTLRLWGVELKRINVMFRFAEDEYSRSEKFKNLITQAKRYITTNPLKSLRLTKEARAIFGFARSPSALELWVKLYQYFPRKSLRALWGIRTFEGGTRPFNSICFSPDGNYALSGDSDKTLKLWDVETGKCVRTFDGHTKSVTSVCFSPDGRYALSGSLDNTLKLWDVETGECLKTFEGHESGVTSVCFSPDGSYALSGSLDKTLKLWDLKTTKCLRTFKGHKWTVTSVCFSPDGRYALSGSSDYTLKLWDVETGECLKTFKGHKYPVYSVCFSPDGKFALSGGGDKTIKLWDVETGECLKTFEGHKDSVNSVCFSPDGKYALSASGEFYGAADYTLRLWDIKTGKCLRTFGWHKWPIVAVCFSPDGRYILAEGWDEALKLWFIDWELEEKEPADWDEEARPYLEIFLTLHTSYGPDDPPRKGEPQWTEEDFQKLLQELRYRGYGWLRPEGVRKKLEELLKEKAKKKLLNFNLLRRLIKRLFLLRPPLIVF